MPMKGRFPIRRTLQYLGQGDVVFKDSVKVMTVNYNTHGELGEGARKFVFFNIPQIQYKNPWVQIMMFKNMTPTPFLRFYLANRLTGSACWLEAWLCARLTVPAICVQRPELRSALEKSAWLLDHYTKKPLHWEDAEEIEAMVLPPFSLKVLIFYQTASEHEDRYP
ncbi:28S ribosomal protein S25, mitochondrial isoform X3 [Hippopotamus amphibius kiboko]|uniref:28S ribosomal protein S25, mitochondrial isoform X3 n=1 Tax=Hippopotamus amphibius kiboko TaxID=575201 RepID=UPI002591EC8D|nr:28S ribosomal protein S25, mitochondrial isoform X3 [Hippopotamus amphibius kiboko]